jgi:hypothetical protein
MIVIIDDIQRSRYDYFLIWGHGLKYQKQIIKKLSEDSDFEIELILKYDIRNIKKFIKQVYWYDYVPHYHLKSKVKYLKKTPKTVMFVFVKNNNPQEFWKHGHGIGHIESEKIVKYKTIFRDMFNDRKNDRRTEDHMIHASDNELQTHHMLTLLGYKDGVYYFSRHKDKPFCAPSFIDNFSTYQIHQINISDMVCNTIDLSGLHKQVKIENTPQYRFLLGENQEYSQYIETHKGVKLRSFYNLKSYANMAKNFDYLNEEFCNNYIIVKKIGKKYIVLDGLHRASILVYQGCNRITVVEVVK